MYLQIGTSFDLEDFNFENKHGTWGNELATLAFTVGKLGRDEELPPFEGEKENGKRSKDREREEKGYKKTSNRQRIATSNERCPPTRPRTAAWPNITT